MLTSARRKATLQAALLAAALAAGPSASRAADPPAADAVHLLDPGRAPQKALAYAPRPGVTSTVLCTMHTQIALADETSQSERHEGPNLKLKLEVRTAEVRPDGTARVEVRVASAELANAAALAAATADALRSRIVAMQGVSGSALVTPRGLVKSINLAPAGAAGRDTLGALDTIRSFIGHLVVPLPDEPVGPGARWERAEQKPLRSDLAVLEKSTYELVSLTGRRAVVRLRFEQAGEAGPQGSPPGTPPGKIDTQAVRTRGQGEWTTDLGAATPTAARWTATVEAQARFTRSTGEKQGLRESMTIDFSIAPAPGIP